jgi:C2H2-type zinc finger
MNWLTNSMDDNEKLPDQINLLLNQSYYHHQTNPFPLYNSNITNTNNDDLTCEMAAWDPQYLQPVAPMNGSEMSPTTANNYPSMMPPESIPFQYYITNGDNSHVLLQELANFSDAGDGNLLDPNWDAISAFLAGRIRPGADVTHVFHCAVCDAEFTNPQALGGHMSAHSKERKNKDGLRSIKPKKLKETESKKLKKNKSCVQHSPN